jgi:excisionase family DNA binding protein
MKFDMPTVYRLLGKTDDAASVVIGLAQRVASLADSALQLVPGNPDGAMSVRQAAKLLGVSRGIIYRLCCEGVMPHNKVGRRVTITPAQLEEYQSQQQQPASSQLRYV